MSSNVEVAPVEESVARPAWARWARQVASIVRLEVAKNFWGKRSLLIYLLAAAPVMLLSVLAVFTPPAREWQSLDGLNILYAAIYGGLILRTVIFFGCAWVFMNLFRGEVVDRSLHYYFLAPVRREVLVVGKYLSGVVTTIILFTLTTMLSFIALYLSRGTEELSRFLADGPGLAHLFAYTSVTALACVGYGAFFLLLGVFFRNPVIPALIAYGWEWLNFLLPPLLKKISVIHYLHSLVPVPVDDGPFAILAQPTPAWIAIPSLFVVTLAVLALASRQVRRMEIKYGTD
ncbi:MAG TPA: hypothetical protein VM866_07685 [Pyrinomonadaceae bacterium]|jgi:ABC-type transport system involved in multi-copper enzyme maturation permease subunit|nr:hypothetical protein [Pyrinomonadaceae bacterium]